MSELVPDPEYAQRALAEIKDQQRLAVEQSKLVGLNVLADITNWVAKVAKGEVKITEYTMKGEPYTVDGMKYLYESTDKLKAMGATLELLGGKQEARNQIHVAILGRGKEPPRKLTPDQVREIVDEVIEE